MPSRWNPKVAWKVRAGRGRQRLVAGCEQLETRDLLSNLPPNFSETVVASNFASPTAMEIAPDGRIFVALQDGRLRVIKNGQVLATSFVNLNVDSTGERGLLGVAFDPNFASNQYVYVYYTVPGSPAHNRVSRFTAQGDVAAPGSEVVLLELDPLNSSPLHNGGAIHFGPDGNLYIAVGDNKVGANAQSLSSLKGKVLRIRPDGTIPTDNPFYNQASGANRAIWALGLRNPYTFAFGTDGQGTARMLVNDVGENTYEKINPGLPGANYGWPATENATGSLIYTNPLYVYNNDASTCAITGGVFYNPSTVQFPTSYAGTYFFSDFCGNWIRRYDAVSDTVTGFATDLPSGTVDLDVAANGSLYYLTGSGSGNGAVVRIDYSSPTPPPNAPTIVVQPRSQTVGLGQSAFFFVAATGAGPLSYQWQRNGRDIPGARLSTLTLPAARASDDGDVFSVLVSNSGGTTSSAEAVLTVVVPHPPAVTITTPAPGSPYVGGQTISFSGGATDPEDGAIPPSSLSWQVDRYDRNGVQTVLGPISGAGGAFTVPQTGDLGLNVFYRITLATRDSTGSVGSSYVDLRPTIASLGLDSQPGGLPITIDGQAVTTPAAISGVAGMIRHIQAPPSAIVGGVIYAFAGWSDGVTEAARSLVFPSTGSTISAAYNAVGIVPYTTIASARTVVSRGVVRGVTLSFDGQVDWSSAASRTAYWLVLAGRDRQLGTGDDRYTRFRAARVSPGTNSVNLIPGSRINARQSFQVVVPGSGGRGLLADVYGRPIDGNRDGQPGGDFVARFGPGSFVPSGWVARGLAAGRRVGGLR